MIEQDLVVAYFETNGFLVRQASHSINSKKKLEVLPVISVLNPRTSQNNTQLNTRLFSADLSKIHSAQVATLGWGNSSFTPASLSSDVQLMKFFKQELNDKRVDGCFSVDTTWEVSGTKSLKLLVVPAMPTGLDRLEKLNQMFEDLEINGVLTLRSILENLLRQSDPTTNYEAHEILQTLRLVKSYGLSRDPQLEIFEDD
jgi:hypothetical protein